MTTMNPQNASRRQFLILTGTATIALLAALRFVQEASAEALQNLPLDNAQAKALAYTEDASSSKHPGYKAGSTCTNCQFFTAATGACALFKGYRVSPNGWCSAWAKKPG
ncbi:MAG: high-potential iron-sulfur protein [Proteobacteria bacterium]|nr:high-potential iron-sulfur protein [Pseudomonadota bacterium]